jgi:hypothetical protein
MTLNEIFNTKTFRFFYFPHLMYFFTIIRYVSTYSVNPDKSQLDLKKHKTVFQFTQFVIQTFDEWEEESRKVRGNFHKLGDVLF